MKPPGHIAELCNSAYPTPTSSSPGIFGAISGGLSVEGRRGKPATLEASLRLELPLGLADEGRRPGSFEKGDAFDVRVEDYHR